MTEEVVVVLDGREFTEDEFVAWLRARGCPEYDISAFIQFVQMHRMMGLTPLQANDLPIDVGESS